MPQPLKFNLNFSHLILRRKKQKQCTSKDPQDIFYLTVPGTTSLHRRSHFYNKAMFILMIMLRQKSVGAYFSWSEKTFLKMVPILVKH